MIESDQTQSILMTGATGYVGGRLLPRLEKAGYHLRCLVRNPENLKDRVDQNTEIVAADVLDFFSLQGKFEDIDTCFYLIHSMGQTEGFEELDRQAASNFGRAAREAGVKRIIYLGGLGDEDESLSPHLKSRHEVGKILRESGVKTIELRASIVIGSGSLSFEMIRALTEKLPIMITPQWVTIKAQPIGIQDLLQYLQDSIRLPAHESRVIEIGGSEQVSYKDLMGEYARIRGLKRVMIPIPVLTPALSSLWLGLVTPLFARIGRKLIDSLRHATVIKDASGLSSFDIRPKGVREMIQDALRHEELEYAETRWSDALSSSGASPKYGGVHLRSRLVDSREILVAASLEEAFKPIADIGGHTGWYAYNWLWQIRGFMDMLVGGVGMRRMRPSGRSLSVGDSLDFWRVEAYAPPQQLRLRAEMKVPGQAWLNFELSPAPEGCKITQTAEFYPRGLSGLLYWYAIYPLHALVFRGMIRGIANEGITSRSNRTL
ncbi:MAG: SDR family oxidoreductase [Candidatus Marinimicrobia bacterium]|nr:SDR family oxidoreductase [Candidatus Neomarinimicrobiota bacterium]